MQIDSMTLELESYIKNANMVKGIVLSRLIDDKVITNEQAKIYDTHWQIIVFKKSWFKRWMEVFSKEEPNGYCYKLVRFEG